ncbi:hypothetical protein T07_13441 [Trichinella nelsoni]|uniref:Uncharacterized protein n=1 Tax=Trichinella nelsoni TaxID=6336 RepID=A0A0V0SFE3_9BILA|nr:hypothetical protein T07_13441 [Trichinella nelsoni]
MRWTAVTDGTVLKQRRTRRYLRKIRYNRGLSGNLRRGESQVPVTAHRQPTTRNGQHRKQNTSSM